MARLFATALFAVVAAATLAIGAPCAPITDFSAPITWPRCRWYPTDIYIASPDSVPVMLSAIDATLTKLSSRACVEAVEPLLCLGRIFWCRDTTTYQIYQPCYIQCTEVMDKCTLRADLDVLESAFAPGGLSAYCKIIAPSANPNSCACTLTGGVQTQRCQTQAPPTMVSIAHGVTIGYAALVAAILMALFVL